MAVWGAGSGPLLSGDLAMEVGAKPPLVATEPEAPVATAFSRQPLLFIENRGQLDPQVAYYVQGRTNSLYFTASGVTIVSADAPATATEEERRAPELVKTALPVRKSRWVTQLDFLAADPSVEPRPEAPQQAVVSYFRGGPQDWRTGLKTYSQLRYPELWPGIDLVYSGTTDRLKYQFEIKPGADPRQIRLAYRGASAVTLTEEGQLDIVTPVGGFRDDRPVAWQEVDGRRMRVPVAYALGPAGESGRDYGFEVGDYDTARPLVLDPAVFVYSGFIGGDGGDRAIGIAVDAAGNAYVTGTTHTWLAALTFPVQGGPDLTWNGGVDAFVAKVAAGGGSLVYAGFIGGSAEDEGLGIAVDGAGNAYVTGLTGSSAGSFPVKVGPILEKGDSTDAFVAKVNPAGTDLVYCGYIGSKGLDYGMGIAVDGAGNAYVAGRFGVGPFVGEDPASAHVVVGPDLTYNGGGSDAFVAKVKADGTGFHYLGYIGGSDVEEAYDIAVDAEGSAYVMGGTRSTEDSFPVLIGPDLTHNGDWDTFVAKVKKDGTGLVYAGYIGGAADDSLWNVENVWGKGIAVDQQGSAYVTGATFSTEATFPVKVGPDLTHNGYLDAFVAKVTASGNSLEYAGYIGGDLDDVGQGIAVDEAGSAYVTGWTQSLNLPVKGGPDLTHNGNWDAFVAKVAPNGAELGYAGYIGGWGPDHGLDIAVDTAGNAYVAGATYSTHETFPVVGGPFLTNGGDVDAFV